MLLHWGVRRVPCPGDPHGWHLPQLPSRRHLRLRRQAPRSSGRAIRQGSRVHGSGDGAGDRLRGSDLRARRLLSRAAGPDRPALAGADRSHDRPRIHRPDDLVRLEIAATLARKIPGQSPSALSCSDGKYGLRLEPGRTQTPRRPRPPVGGRRDERPRRSHRLAPVRFAFPPPRNRHFASVMNRCLR